MVDFKPDKVKIVHKPSNEVLLEGELDSKIKVEDSFWTIEEKKRLILRLCKASETIWKTVIKGD